MSKLYREKAVELRTVKPGPESIKLLSLADSLFRMGATDVDLLKLASLVAPKPAKKKPAKKKKAKGA